jgi:hypothetical protein
VHSGGALACPVGSGYSHVSAGSFADAPSGIVLPDFANGSRMASLAASVRYGTASYGTAIRPAVVAGWGTRSGSGVRRMTSSRFQVANSRSPGIRTRLRHQRG